MNKTVANWSGGKDGMLALHKWMMIQPDSELCLLTRYTVENNMVSMHHVGMDLIKIQAQNLGLKLKSVDLPKLPDNVTFSKIMSETWQQLLAEGYKEALFGDIFLEDIRLWQEMQLNPLGIKCHFPLWKTNTMSLAEEFIDRGFRAVIVSVDAECLDEDTPGKYFDKKFIEELPENVDPCGENGEFHTFVFDGPGFKKPVNFNTGEINRITYPSPMSNHSEKVFWYTSLKLSE